MPVGREFLLSFTRFLESITTLSSGLSELAYPEGDLA
jgi:hypothetical protein